MFLNFVVKSKKSMFVIVILTLIIFAAVIFTLNFMTNKIKYGKKLNFTMDNITMDKYYAVYDMTVISNKNINTYNVKEWYDKIQNYSKLEYMDYMKNKVVVENKEEVCTITNSGNVAKLITSNIMHRDNVSSLSTFVKMFNMADACSCSKNVYKNGEKLSFVLDIKEEACDINKLIGDLKISKIELDVKDNKPLNYVVYDKNKKEYISIVYSEFILNEQE